MPWLEPRLTRIDALDGKGMSWTDVTPYVYSEAIDEAKWAEMRGVPTICMGTATFSPHLTLGSIACALSHKRAWEWLRSSENDFALIMEDDVLEISDALDEHVEHIVREEDAGATTPALQCYS